MRDWSEMHVPLASNKFNGMRWNVKICQNDSKCKSAHWSWHILAGMHDYLQDRLHSIGKEIGLLRTGLDSSHLRMSGRPLSDPFCEEPGRQWMFGSARPRGRYSHRIWGDMPDRVPRRFLVIFSHKSGHFFSQIRSNSHFFSFLALRFKHDFACSAMCRMLSRIVRLCQFFWGYSNQGLSVHCIILDRHTPREPKTYKKCRSQVKKTFFWKKGGKTRFLKNNYIYPLGYCIEPRFMPYNKFHIIFNHIHVISFTFECYHDNISI